MKSYLKILIAALIFYAAVSSLSLASADSEATQHPQRVLALFSNYIGMPWDDLVNKGLNDAIFEKDRTDLELDIEYLDLSRNQSENYESIILQLLEARYGQRQPDIIISSLDFISAQTLLLSISRLFPEAKIISLSNQAPSENRALYSGRVVSFYNEPFFHANQVEFVQKALPKVRQIYFITGASPQERGDLNKAIDEFDAFKNRFDFVYYTGLPLDELLDRVRLIPENAAIIFSTYFRDTNDNVYVPARVLEAIHKNANAPIFGSVDTFLGRGIVGGKLTSAEELGREAGERALSILGGEASDDIYSMAVPALNMFDWRELQRWHIDESQLPEDSIIRYREFSFFELYKWHLLIGACIVLIESILIGLLLATLSKRKSAEKALSGSEKKYRRLVENLRDGVISIDKNQMITGFNTGAMRILGYREHDIIGLPITTLIPPDERERQIENIAEVIGKGIFSDYESTRLKKDGTPVPVRIIQSTLKNEADKIIGLVEIVRDISREKQAKQEKAELELALQQAHKMEAIGTLAGGIAHDFNNILAAIIGFTEFALLDVAPGSSIESSLQEVMKAGIRARDLVNQILTFARRNNEVVRPISVLPIADEALKLIRSTTPSSVEIRKKLEAESPILADPVKIHQIFMNICVNAAQSMKDGGLLEVAVTHVPENDVPLEKQANLPPNDYLKIRISDTGSGIPENAIALIFEPYFTTKEMGDGSGLGLSVVHGIVKSYGGEIFVDSAVDQGTVFTIYFPITKEQPKEAPPESIDLPRGSERILVVDDEPAIIKMMSQLLVHLGYSVTSRTDSAEALAFFQKNPEAFDLVVTDMAMPSFAGDILAREINKIRSDIPIVLCTGYSKSLSSKKPHGINALLMKPVEQKDLARVVRRLLDDTLGTGMKK